MTYAKGMFSPSQTLSHYTRINVFIWLALAFQAGAINAGGFMACHRFVSHTTGFATNFGTELGLGEWQTGLSMLSVPLFFMLGAMLSAYYVDRRIQAGFRPLYPIVMGLLALILCAVVCGGVTDVFSPFGEDLILSKDYPLLAALAFACGLQNATITSSFGAVIRTTHLTGLTTDLGIGLMRVLTHSHHLNSRQNEIRANTMRIGIFMAFAMGAAVSAALYSHFAYWGFALPALIAIELFGWSLFRFFHSKNYIKLEHLQAGEGKKKAP